MAVGFEYVGATGRDLGLGGSNDGIININQVPIAAPGARRRALNANVPNPFFGLPPGRASTSRARRFRAAQLLRPFPQFGDILMRQTTGGENQYHAAILKLEKRMSNGWGGRINYTYSRLKDNQFGETQLLLARLEPRQQQTPTTSMPSTAIGLLDVPHKLVVLADHRAAVRRGQAVGCRAASAPRSSATGRSRRSSRSRAASRSRRTPTPTTQLFRRMQRVQVQRAEPTARARRSTPTAAADGAPDALRHEHLAQLGRLRASGWHSCSGTLPANARATCARRTATTGTSSASKDDSPERQRARADPSRGAEHHQHRRRSADRRSALAAPTFGQIRVAVAASCA